MDDLSQRGLPMSPCPQRLVVDFPTCDGAKIEPFWIPKGADPIMHAGLYDDSHRSRELVWILMEQRAARGLGSLYAHADEMTMEQAGRVHMQWTPRGWMKKEKELLIFEQYLYLRQPGYGTSYITGKYLLERTLADYAKQLRRAGRGV